MFFDISNDRTAHRQIGHVSHSSHERSPQLSCIVWLTQQIRMLEGWQAELISHNADPELLQSLQTHGAWLKIMIEDLRAR